MNSTQVLPAESSGVALRAPVTGAYKVDISRGERIGRVSSEWFSRPDDERYLSLSTLYEAVRARAERATARTVETRHVRVEASRDDAERLALNVPGRDAPIAPTHWSFGQMASLVGAPAGYLRQLPAALAGINLQHGLLAHRGELIKTLEADDGRIELRAVTGPDYGRIWDHELVGAVMKIAGDGVGDTRWKVPGLLDWSTMTHNPFVEVTKDTTTLYASDRDVFLFLVDDAHPIEAGRLPNGDPDLYFRGFYCWNSEVGSKTLGMASFYLRAVCMNRNIWGAEGFEEISIRHSKFAGHRFAHEAAPALERFATSSPVPFMAGIKAAREAIVARKDEDRETFLRKRGFSKSETDKIIKTVLSEEGYPIVSRSMSPAERPDRSRRRRGHASLGSRQRRDQGSARASRSCGAFHLGRLRSPSIAGGPTAARAAPWANVIAHVAIDLGPHDAPRIWRRLRGMVDDKTILLAALDEAQAAFVKVNPMPSLLGSSPDGEILGPLEMAIEQCAAYQSVAGQVLFCGGSGPVLHAGPLASLLFSKGAWPTDNKDGAVDWLLKLLRTREATVLVIHLITSEYAPLIRDHVLPAVAKSRGRPWMEQLSEYFLRKSTRHLEAVCALVTESFGEDGLIIGRTLLEHSLYLAWVAAAGSPALQDERAQHFLFDGDRQRFEKRRELGRLKDEGKCLAWVDPLLTAEIETPAMAKPASFTSLPSLKRMAEELGGEFECYFHFVYWSVSKLAHPSGMGSHSYYVDDDGSEAWRALAFAFPQHALMTANTLAMFNEDELRSAVEQLARRFIALDSSSEPGASERQA